KKWGVRIPLLLVDAHESLAHNSGPDRYTNYWKNPAIWADVRAAHEKFFALNPSEVGWRHNYAKSAYLCDGWDVFNEQLTLLSYTNYSFFGGQTAFENMVQTSQRKAGKQSSPPAETVKKTREP
ncbi:MAG TPA: hypothetical protein VNM37_01590, partial [Candidatus Dormibacteraeota bacterium]|nr:hypothetical protein [Candidatus Dormibacteraeota bacterium]